jgi:sugar-specific transcriptional regulator TrmB
MSLEEELAELDRRWEELVRMPFPPPKPKVEVVASVSSKMAEAIKANPTSLRLSVNRPDEIPVVDRPQKVEVMEVLEVDAQGRPSRVARFECATGERSVIEFVDGYRQPSGAVSVYDPLAALKGDRND